MGRLAPVLLWLVVIVTLSASAFSTAHTRVALTPILHCLFPGMQRSGLARVHAGLRKVGHLIEYAVLAVLCYRAVPSRSTGGRRKAGTALVLAVMIGGLDELHQRFVPGRMGTVKDWALDAIGAALGLGVAFVVDRTRRRERRDEPH